jgi:hypothetical protein
VRCCWRLTTVHGSGRIIAYRIVHRVVMVVWTASHQRGWAQRRRSVAMLWMGRVRRKMIGDAWLHEVTMWRDVERRSSSNGGRKVWNGSMEHWYGTALSHGMEHRNGAALHLSRHRTLEWHIVKSRRQDKASQVGMMAWRVTAWIKPSKVWNGTHGTLQVAEQMIVRVAEHMIARVARGWR